MYIQLYILVIAIHITYVYTYTYVHTKDRRHWRLQRRGGRARDALDLDSKQMHRRGLGQFPFSNVLGSPRIHTYQTSGGSRYLTLDAVREY